MRNHGNQTAQQTYSSLAEVALTRAEVTHNPLATHRGLIERAAREVVRFRPDGDADDVLLWATCLRLHGHRGLEC